MASTWICLLRNRVPCVVKLELAVGSRSVLRPKQFRRSPAARRHNTRRTRPTPALHSIPIVPHQGDRC
jgi:hypothetical protein